MKKRVWLKPLPILRLVLSLLIAGQAIPAREVMAALSTSVHVRVVSPSAGLPTAVTAISAAPDFSSTPDKTAGGVTLSWSAPMSSDSSKVYSYVVKYATFPASDFGNSDAWWNSPKTLTAIENGLPASWGRLAHSMPGSTETIKITGLTPGAYYYFGIRARDNYFRMADYDDGLKSISNQAKAYAATDPWTPAKITSLRAQTNAQVGAVKLSWTVPEFFDLNSNLVQGKIYHPGEYCVQYSTVQPGSVSNPNMVNNWDSSTRIFISTSNVRTNDQQSVSITGLMLPTTYYFVAFTRNEWPGHWSVMPTQYAAAIPFNSMKPVTGLNAVPGAVASVGTGSYVNLSWTNPTGENNIKGVRICYSTTGIPATPDSVNVIDLQPETSGQARLYQHVQLIPRATYYYTVYTYDANRFYSFGSSTQCYINKDYLAPEAVNGYAATAAVDASGASDVYRAELSWTTPSANPQYRNADYAGAMVYFSTYTQVASTTTQTYLCTVNGANSQLSGYTHNNLAAYTTYYYSIFSFDSVGNVSTAPATVSAYISEALITPAKPQVITMLVEANPDQSIGSSIYLRWSTPQEMTVTGTRLVWRTDRYPLSAADGSVWVDKAAAPNSTYSFTATKLDPSTTYYIALYAYTSAGTYSRSETISGYTAIPWVDNLAPFAPLGLSIARSSPGAVELAWVPVKFNVDRTMFADPNNPTIKDVSGYEIYRSTEIFGDWVRVAVRKAGATKFVDPMPAPGQYGTPSLSQYYYKVRAKDASGNYSDSNLISVDGYVHVACADGSILSLEQSKVQENMIVSITRETNDEKGPIIKSVEWEPYRITESSPSFTMSKVNNFRSYEVSNSTSELSGLFISYMTGTGSGAQTAPALRTMSDADIEHNVSIFYYNGIEWLKLASTVDKERKLVAAKAKFAGRYQLRKAPQATEFTFFSVMPRIITPNNDNQNDRALFRYANPKASSISIKIFDIRGALVRKLDASNATSDNHGDYIYWDGTDKDSVTVPIGVYVYQLEGEGKVVNGTIVVAR